MRELKFRVWNGEQMVSPNYIDRAGYACWKSNSIPQMVKDKVMQYTGLKDKNGDNEIYECDIIDTDGNVIGNQYETPALLKEKTNLLIQGFGTKAWLTTYTQAVERGCHDA